MYETTLFWKVIIRLYFYLNIHANQKMQKWAKIGSEEKKDRK